MKAEISLLLNKCTSHEIYCMSYNSHTKHNSITLKGHLMPLSTPRVMGIINATPDSFFKGSRANVIDEAVDTAMKMIEEGADMLDIGGCSTRPGADDIPIEQEMERVVPLVSTLLKEKGDLIISVDTFRSAVAKEAVGAGAALVNDISGGSLDPEMFATVASLGVPYILMHSRGNPKTMQSLVEYDHLLFELLDFFALKTKELYSLGCRDIIIDPGFGFAKTREQNFFLLKNLSELRMIGCPVLAGLSRKSMIWKTLGTSPDSALTGTIGLQMLALHNGASILRVHDVIEAVQTVKLYNEYNAQNLITA